MLLNCSNLLDRGVRKLEALKKIRKALCFCLRDTDIKGWFREDAIIGVILTEIARIDDDVRKQILDKTQCALCRFLGSEEAKKVKISVLVLPEDLMKSETGDIKALSFL